MDILCLDIYLSDVAKSQSVDGLKTIQYQNLQTPLHCWDAYFPYYRDLLSKSKKQADINRLLPLIQPINPAYNLDFILSKSYSALVFTDASQIIKWVDPGFFKMTGYTKKFAIGQSPKFLQGPETTIASKKRLKQHLNQGGVFKETVINYKADRSIYRCEIEIRPIHNSDGVLHAYLALETELS